MSDEHDPPPCCVALLAGTLTLMTAFADDTGDRTGAATQRRMMARKIASNLFFLSQHPDLPPPFRTVAARLQAGWAERGAVTAGAPSPAPIDDDRAGTGRLH